MTELAYCLLLASAAEFAATRAQSEQERQSALDAAQVLRSKAERLYDRSGCGLLVWMAMQ